eukprot:Nk52_evm2s316 gene=Nk52_evmTU2s316
MASLSAMVKKCFALLLISTVCLSQYLLFVEGSSVSKHLEQLKAGSEELISTFKAFESDAKAKNGNICVVEGVCYQNIGQFYKPNSGTQGTGGVGCANILFGCKEGHRTFCSWSPCPLDFLPTGKPLSTCSDNGEICMSMCNEYQKDLKKCVLNQEVLPLSTSDHSKWMADFQSTKLSELLVVGAHHTLAGVQNVNFNLMAEKETLEKIITIAEVLGPLFPFPDLYNQTINVMLPMMLNTQASGTSTLLKRGVRLFDYRPYHFTGSDKFPDIPDGLYDYHAGQGPAIKPEMQAIASFLRENPTEVVYMEVQNFLTTDCYHCASDAIELTVSIVEEIFGACSESNSLLYCGEHDFTKPVSNYAGKVIVMSHDENFLKQPYVVSTTNSEDQCTDEVSVCARWYNKNGKQELINALKSDTNATQLTENDPNMLRLIQWQLTANGNDYGSALTQRVSDKFTAKSSPEGCGSLACMARVDNAKAFFNAFGDSLSDIGGRANILMIDFSDMKGTAEAVIAYNKKRNSK